MKTPTLAGSFTKPLLAVLLGAALLTGCVVMSVYPYYYAKDLTFDPALVGDWVDVKAAENSGESWTFEKHDERTYRLTIKDTEKSTEFDARMFTLKGTTFLDVLERERREFSVPTHLLVRVERLSPTLDLKLLNADWLRELLEKHPKALRHVVVPKKSGEGEGGDLVLTADTAELQKFVLKQLKNEDAWTGGGSMHRK